MRRWIPVLALTALACGERRTEIDKPTPPDMSDVVQLYAAPDGVFDQASAQAILAEYQSRAASVAAIGLTDEVLDALRASMDEALASSTKTSPALDEPGVTRQSLELETNGTMRVERICGGWGTEPVPDRENGTLTGYVNFTEAGLDPVIWGNADACQYRVGDVSNVLIDGGESASDLELWIGDGVTFESFGSSPVIFDVDLATEVDGVAAPLALSFRVDPSTGHVELALDASPGAVIVSPQTSGTLSVQAQNGTFECDLSASQCTSDSGQSFSF